jgi:hypothetical protein
MSDQPLDDLGAIAALVFVAAIVVTRNDRRRSADCLLKTPVEPYGRLRFVGGPVG